MKLYPFQQEVLTRMLEFLYNNKSHAVYNACEQGLGKCAMSVRAAEVLEAKRIIIVCPAVMRLTWKDEIEKWRTSTPDYVFPILSSTDITKETDFSKPGWTIISYSLVTELQILNKLVEQKYDLLILDEAHYTKNMRARRTRACLLDLWPSTKYRILLSGTPCTTSIIDLYTAAHRCAKETFRDFDQFAHRYTHVRIHPQWGARYVGLKHGEELKNKLRQSFFIRRTKEEVLPDLPPKTYQQITLPRTLAVVPKNKSEADQLDSEIAAVAEMVRHGKAPVVPKTLAEHKRLQGERKVPAVVEFCKDLLENEVPVVLFGWHQNVIEMFRTELKAFSPSVITGSTPAGKRHDEVKRFQSGGTPLFIANLVAGGVGITLHRAHICVLGELDWAPSTVAQATDRLHRIGQLNPVTVYYFVVKDSLDETISRVVIDRARTISKVVEN